MKPGDVYQHYKGGHYKYLGETIRFPSQYIGETRPMEVFHTEKERKIIIYQSVKNEYMSINESETLVLYRKIDSDDLTIYGRPKEMFFGKAKNSNNRTVNRFKPLKKIFT